MDLNEAAQRIFKYHWFLILVVTIVGVTVPAWLAHSQDDEYVASARIVMGAEDARDSKEANALADTALALATSPGVLGQALDGTGLQRDEAQVADQVRVDAVGSSGVLQLSVTDPDPVAAASIANQLATAVVAQRQQAILGDTERLLAQADERIVALAGTVTAIEAEADEAARADAAARARGLAPTSSLDAIVLRHRQAVEQLNQVRAQRQELAQTLAQAVRPAVIDASATRGTLVDTGLATRLAIGGLLGLLLGIALAATREASRPTLGPASLARYMGVPLLGRLRQLPQGRQALPDPWLPRYVRLAADRAGVRSFELVPVGPPADVTGLARSLAEEGESEGSREIVPVALDGPHDARLPAGLTHPDTGVVVIAPKKVKSAWLVNLERHVRLTGQPVLGVITYGGRPPTMTENPGRVAQTQARRPMEPDTAPAPAATS